MPTSAAGNSRRRRASQGFTLLELLVVITIIAIASAGVIFALRDDAADRLAREGQRLAALLDAARAQSRASGAAVRWLPQGQGFVFEGLPPAALPTRWLDASIAVSAPALLILGPDPIIAPQAVVLQLRDRPDVSVQVATDGLGPFQVRVNIAQASP